MPRYRAYGPHNSRAGTARCCPTVRGLAGIGRESFSNPDPQTRVPSRIVTQLSPTSSSDALSGVRAATECWPCRCRTGCSRKTWPVSATPCYRRSMRPFMARSFNGPTRLAEFQIFPEPIGLGALASGTHSTRSTLIVSVGSPICSGPHPENTKCSEPTAPTIGWNVARCSTRPARRPRGVVVNRSFNRTSASDSTITRMNHISTLQSLKGQHRRSTAVRVRGSVRSERGTR